MKAYKKNMFSLNSLRRTNSNRSPAKKHASSRSYDQNGIFSEPIRLLSGIILSEDLFLFEADMRALLALIFSSSLLFSGCGLSPVESGFGGAAVGAGTGALIASSLSNGDIAASAGLGAAIGFPAGIVLCLAADALMTPGSGSSSKQDAFVDEIAENQEEIFENNKRIQELRRDANQEIPEENPPSHNRRRLYDGPVLGNYYR